MSMTCAPSSTAVAAVDQRGDELAGGDPTVKGVDLFFGPRAVTGHCAGANSSEDVVGVGRDVIVGPEVEPELIDFRSRGRNIVLMCS